MAPGGGRRKQDKNASKAEQKKRMEQELQKIRDEYQDVIGKPVDITDQYLSKMPTWCDAILDKMKCTKDEAAEE